MALWYYGHEHWWFAWHPIETCCGWRWLRRVRRRRVYLGDSVPGAAEWWDYRIAHEPTVQEQPHD